MSQPLGVEIGCKILDLYFLQKSRSSNGHQVLSKDSNPKHIVASQRSPWACLQLWPNKLSFSSSIDKRRVKTRVLVIGSGWVSKHLAIAQHKI